ncbi:uncharacterized protein KIAA0825-like [Styela clava]
MPNSEILVDTKTTFAILSNAIKDSLKIEHEILQLISQLPIITSNYLPRDLSLSAQKDDESGSSEEDFIFKKIAKWAIEQLKYHLDNVDNNIQHEKYKGQIMKVCQFVEILNFLGGCDYAKEKFSNVLSKKCDVILQNNMEYIQEVSKNILQVEENFTHLVADTKHLALNSVLTLFLCEGIHLNCNEQFNLISDPILEKLSVELLTLVDSLKDSIFKQLSVPTIRSSIGGSSHINLFTALAETIGEDTCFKRQELVSLANIVNAFLNLETTLRRSEYTILWKSKSKDEGMRRSALKQRSQLPDLLRSSQESSWVRSSQIYGNWNWQEILKEIGPVIIKSITKVFDECQTNEINSSRNVYHANDSCNITTVPSISSTVLSGPDVPREVIACFGEILKLMKTLLPYAILGSQYRPLSGFCTCYIDECSQSLKSMKSFLMMLLNDVPSKAPMNTLYYVLATCDDVCSMLTFYASKMEPDPRIPFQGILKVYKDLSNTIKNIITQCLKEQLSMYILHDADGNHWSDVKEFGEGTGCSHSVAMWNLFLHQLWSDFGSCMSDMQRNDIFTDVFTSSLSILQSRYSRCKVSYNRAKQLAFDITAILHTCKTFFFHINFFMTSNFLRNVPVYSIDATSISSKLRTSCDMLISILYLLSCPLEVIEKSIAHSESMTIDNTANWLCLMFPEIFHEGWNGCFSDMTNNAAVKFVLKMDVHPSQSSILCLFGIVMRDYFVIDQLFTQKLDFSHVNDYGMCDFEADIFSIFTSCSSSFHEAFFHIVFISVQRDVTKLTELSLPGIGEQYTAEFLWQHILHSTLSDILCQSMRRLGTYVSSLTWSFLGCELISSLPASMKDQIFSIKNSKIDDKNSCELVCIIILVQGIEQAMYGFPEWLVTFLIHFKEAVISGTKGDIFVLGNGILHMLLHSTCHVLRSPALWEKHHGIELLEEGVEWMERISDRLLHFCGENHQLPSDNFLYKTTLQHINNLHTKINIHFSSRRVSDLHQEHLFMKCERMLGNMEIQDIAALKSVHRIKLVIHKNYELLFGECSNQRGQKTEDDNLLNKWKRFCAQNSEHDVSDIDNWSKICKGIVSGLDRGTLDLLLSHRWEMKQGAFMDEKHAQIVKRIKLCLSRP